jgi:hypothetical protein
LRGGMMVEAARMIVGEAGLEIELAVLFGDAA